MKIALLGIAGILIALLAYAALQSPHYEVSRTVTIKASPEKVFPHLNDSRLADKWGPWSEVDPEAKMILTGPEAGVGSKTSWDSKGQLGTGSATIVESVPNQRVGIKLEYTKPMQMQQYAEYIVEPAGAETKVTWKVTGENNFMGRLMCVFMNMDKMVGGMFEKGLNNLKTIVEKT